MRIITSFIATILILCTSGALAEKCPESSITPGKSDLVLAGVSMGKSHVEDLFRLFGSPLSAHEAQNESFPLRESGFATHAFRVGGAAIMASTEFHRDEAGKTVETVLALSIRSVRPYPWLQTGRGAGIDDSPERIRSLYGPVLLKQPVNAEKPRGIPMAYCFSDQSELVFGIEDDKVASILVAVSAK